jgi:predicted RNA-binding Zn ribbon-like protein
VRRDDRSIPPELALLTAFVNTLDVEEATDHLASPAAFATWIESVGLDQTSISRRDLAAAIEVRDALRRMLLAHSGNVLRPDEVPGLNTVVARYRAGIEFDVDARPIVRPRGTGPDELIARILVEVATAAALGLWERCKLCPAEDCLWAFFDHSKNRSRRWCSMDLCGNRTKSKAFRQRHR